MSGHFQVKIYVKWKQNWNKSTCVKSWEYCYNIIPLEYRYLLDKLFHKSGMYTFYGNNIACFAAAAATVMDIVKFKINVGILL